MRWRRRRDDENDSLDNEVLRHLLLIHTQDGRGGSRPSYLAVILSGYDLAGLALESEIARACKRLHKRRLVSLLRDGEVMITGEGLRPRADAHTRMVEISAESAGVSAEEYLQRNRVGLAFAACEAELAEASNAEIASLDTSLAIDARQHGELRDYVRLNEVLTREFFPAEARSLYEALGQAWSPGNGGWADGTTTAQKLAITSSYALGVEASEGTAASEQHVTDDADADYTERPTPNVP